MRKYSVPIVLAFSIGVAAWYLHNVNEEHLRNNLFRQIQKYAVINKRLPNSWDEYINWNRSNIVFKSSYENWVKSNFDLLWGAKITQKTSITEMPTNITKFIIIKNPKLKKYEHINVQFYGIGLTLDETESKQTPTSTENK